MKKQKNIYESNKKIMEDVISYILATYNAIICWSPEMDPARTTGLLARRFKPQLYANEA